MTRMVPTPAEKKAEELRVVIREANEVLAEMKRTLREIKATRSEIDKAIETNFEQKIASVVADTLASYRESIDKAIEDATNSVFKRFDTIMQELLGETRRHRRRGEKSLPQMVAEAKQARDL